MSAYSELVKNFEKIRAYMRDFYVYGFKSREEYQVKSARSYDDEKRRIESWLGDHMGFVRTPEGKNVFISIDSRTIRHNPFHRAWKAKSFTDGDITLHFILFDILHDPSVKRTVTELLEQIDGEYLSAFEDPMLFDESTLRKKLKEYCREGIIAVEKVGRRAYYHRTETADLADLNGALHYFSEVAPCGVIGSFLLDKTEADTDAFTFKHHYITGAIDSGVLAELFAAMQEKRAVTVTNHGRGRDKTFSIVPLKIYISVQSGRQHLIAYHPGFDRFLSYRIDYLSHVTPNNPVPDFDELREELERMKHRVWGVNFRADRTRPNDTEHIQFTVRVEEGEDHILQRLEREKRWGYVERPDENTCRFSADVYDSGEAVPWIRTFLCRITDLHFSNKMLEQRFRDDLKEMYRIYGVEEEAQE